MVVTVLGNGATRQQIMKLDGVKDDEHCNCTRQATHLYVRMLHPTITLYFPHFESNTLDGAGLSNCQSVKANNKQTYLKIEQKVSRRK